MDRIKPHILPGILAAFGFLLGACVGAPDNPPRPKLHAIEPTHVLQGEIVTIYGENFGEAPGADDSIYAGRAPSEVETEIVSWADDEIRVRIHGCGASGLRGEFDGVDRFVQGDYPRVFCHMEGTWEKFIGWMQDPLHAEDLLAYAIDNQGALHAFPTGSTSSILVDAGPWNEVAVAPLHGCGVKADGTLWCWGKHAGGRTTQSVTTSTPQQVDALADWAQVAVSDAASCALREDGRLYCWGSNRDYGLASSSDPAVEAWIPALVESPVHLQLLRGSIYRFCGIDDENALVCWGRLKTRRIASRPITVETSADMGWLDFEPALTVDFGIGCGIAGEDRQLWCDSRVGANEIDLSLSDSMSWANVSLAGGFLTLASGCGVTTDGELRCISGNGWEPIIFESLGEWAKVKVHPYQPENQKHMGAPICLLHRSGSLFCESATVPLHNILSYDLGKGFDQQFDDLIDLAEGAE
jgi:hypothetical protein